MAFPQNPCSTPSSVSAAARQVRSGHFHSNPVVQGGGTQGEHQLEKLEFALAVALTRGDQDRSADLRRQIDALGGNCEEPGT
ncbi:MAG: hypothetical protein VKM92_01050 [Cyanobacteriota bacterium]|nr:hypothetical protein [Cyanobacteriota bacterium]